MPVSNRLRTILDNGFSQPPLVMSRTNSIRSNRGHLLFGVLLVGFVVNLNFLIIVINEILLVRHCGKEMQ